MHVSSYLEKQNYFYLFLPHEKTTLIFNTFSDKQTLYDKYTKIQ